MLRLEVITVTCPAGTVQATPREADFTFASGEVKHVEVRIPPGHAFLTGIALARAHQPLLPWTAGQYLIGDDDRLGYDITDNIRSGSWSVFTYNLDPVNDHTWQVRLQVEELPPPARGRPTATSTLATIPPAALRPVAVKGK